MPQEGQEGTGPGRGEVEGSWWGLGGGREMDSVFSDLSGHTIETMGEVPGRGWTEATPCLNCLIKALRPLILMLKAPCGLRPNLHTKYLLGK